MKLSELAAYAEEKYHMAEEHKWDSFPGFSVLADPDTGKWAALLMRQWDYESGTELVRCDIKCGRQCIAECGVPYVTDPFRMKGKNWVGVIFDERTEPEVVFRLLDRAAGNGDQRGYKVVLEEDGGQVGAAGAGRIYKDTLLPLEALRGNYDKRRLKERQQKTGSIQENTPQIPPRILEMMKLYEYGSSSFEHKCRNFCRQGKFMEDYEDDYIWKGELQRYFATYHDLNLNQLRGFFGWRTRLRRGEFSRISTSMAYMYIYELLNGIGAADAKDSIRKMKEFEAGYLDSGVGDESMRHNLHRWMMDLAVLSGAPAEVVLRFIDPALIERDRQLMVLKRPWEHTDEEIFDALSSLTGGKIERSSVLQKDSGRGKHLFAEVWRYLAANYSDAGWDIFAACFGKLSSYPWRPLANAIYWEQGQRKDREYVVNECRKYVCRNGEWHELRYDELFFDRYRIHALVREADRQLRRYVKAGHYLKKKEEGEWIEPFVAAVIEADKAAAREAAKPAIAIDLSHLDKIRRDAQITRDSLLTEEEVEETVLPSSAENMRTPVPISLKSATIEVSTPESHAAEVPEIPLLDRTHAEILLSLLRGEPVAERIRSGHLLASVVTDTINEAMFEEIGDNVLECDGDKITLVEDYREDLEEILEGEH